MVFCYQNCSDLLWPTVQIVVQWIWVTHFTVPVWKRWHLRCSVLTYSVISFEEKGSKHIGVEMCIRKKKCSQDFSGVHVLLVSLFGISIVRSISDIFGRPMYSQYVPILKTTLFLENLRIMIPFTFSVIISSFRLFRLGNGIEDHHHYSNE